MIVENKKSKKDKSSNILEATLKNKPKSNSHCIIFPWDLRRHTYSTTEF